MKSEINVKYSDISELDTLDIYYPDKSNGKTFVYFHGGGFNSGDKADFWNIKLAESFTSKGFTFVSINYSLYPNTKFPQFLIEGAKAIKFICNYLKDMHPYVSGQSAGSWLAMMLCYNTKYLLDEDINPLDIAGWVFESGQATSHFNLLEYEKGIDPLAQRIDEMAPLYFVNKNTNMSPALFILYDNDMPNRYEQNKLLIKATLNYNSNIKITDILLHGTHCLASTSYNSDGEMGFVIEAIKWIKQNN